MIKRDGKGAFLGLIFPWEGLYGRIITERKACRDLHGYPFREHSRPWI